MTEMSGGCWLAPKHQCFLAMHLNFEVTNSVIVVSDHWCKSELLLLRVPSSLQQLQYAWRGEKQATFLKDALLSGSCSLMSS